MKWTLKAFWAGKTYCFVLHSASFGREVKAKFLLFFFACHGLAVGSSEASPFLKQPWITKTLRIFFYFWRFKKVACSQGTEQLLFYMPVGRIVKDTVKNTK